MPLPKRTRAIRSRGRNHGSRGAGRGWRRGVDGLLVRARLLVGIEGGHDDDIGQAGGPAGLAPDRQRLAGGPFLLAGVEDEAEGLEQIPVQVAVPVQAGGEVVVPRIAGVLPEEGCGEAREAPGRRLVALRAPTALLQPVLDAGLEDVGEEVVAVELVLVDDAGEDVEFLCRFHCSVTRCPAH